MKKLLVAAALLLVPVLASAQQLPPGKWWRKPEVVEALGLTEDQQTKLEATWRASANDLIDLRGEVEKQSVALRSELEAAPLNRQNIQRIAGRLNDARGRLFERELMLLVDMRGTLTDSQWTRMRNFLDRMGRAGDGGPPGPNGPPPRGQGGMGQGGGMRGPGGQGGRRP